ncbi:MAG: ATP-binding protein, partial [Candidatus Sericytochromatia bacterium]
RFYAGVPLRTEAGHVLGSLCVADRQPRELNPFQLSSLQILANQVMQLLKQHRYALRLQQQQAQDSRLRREQQRFQVYQEQLTRLSYQIELSCQTLLDRGLGILCAFYDLPGGSVSRIQGGVLEIVACQDPRTHPIGHNFVPGMKSPLAGSAIAQIYDQDEVLSWDELSPSNAAWFERLRQVGLQTLIGSTFWVNGQPYGVVTVYDYTPRPQGYSAMERQFLEVFVRWVGFILERSFYIEHLQKLNLGKDRLLAVVAHDLRNPIGSALSARRIITQQLAQGKPVAPKILGIIDTSCKQALALIDELLEVAELEQEQLKLPLEPMRFSSFIEEVQGNFSPRAAEKQLSLSWESEADRAMVALNPRKMVRVLENLLHNALKFTPPGGEIRLRLQQQNQLVRLTIEDTGIGIPAELQAVLFDKFSAARRQGLGGERSNGLGMYIVQEIVQLHGGQIRVFSQESQGTRFEIELPLLHVLEASPAEG